MKSFLSELTVAIVHKCSKKGTLKILEELTRKQQHHSTTSFRNGCNLANMPRKYDIRLNNCVQKLCI